MDIGPSSAQPPQGLSIGELATRTGVSISTLRIWEARHGFPRPQRLGNGHRRYHAGDVERVVEVQRLRSTGLHLDAAIEQVTTAPGVEPSPPTSVFATLRRAHPDNPVRELRKSTLLGLSWAIEDEFAAHARRGHLFGAFQLEANYAVAASRWAALARVASSTHVFADFTPPPAQSTGQPPALEPGPAEPRRVTLDDRHPMRREWAVVCDRADLPVALSAWELPGQDRVRDRDRIFETVWTIDPAAVRTAALACARAAQEAGSPDAEAVVGSLERARPVAVLDPGAVTGLLTRVVAYVDRATA